MAVRGAVLDTDDGEGVGVEGAGPIEVRASARLGEVGMGQGVACRWGAGAGGRL